MNSQPNAIDTKRYARCVEVGKRIWWDIDRDVIRGRKFDASGTQQPHFAQVLRKLISANQAFRINAKLAPILQEYANASNASPAIIHRTRSSVTRKTNRQRDSRQHLGNEHAVLG